DAPPGSRSGDRHAAGRQAGTTGQVVPQLLAEVRPPPGSLNIWQAEACPTKCRQITCLWWRRRFRLRTYTIPLLHTGAYSFTSRLTRAAVWLGWQISNVNPVGARDLSFVLPSRRWPSKAARMSSVTPT